MDKLDEIIDRHSLPVVQAPRVEDPIIIFTCQHDGYDVYYAPSLGQATYRFANGMETDVDHLTRDQVAYFEEVGYWKRI